MKHDLVISRKMKFSQLLCVNRMLYQYENIYRLIRSQCCVSSFQILKEKKVTNFHKISFSNSNSMADM